MLRNMVTSLLEHEEMRTSDAKAKEVRRVAERMISLGKDGSLAGLSDGIYKVDFPRVDIINTVGSGDSFIAGCAVALVRKYSETDTLKFATACGSANTQYSQTGYVEQDKVDEFFEKVTVKKIADY